MSSTLDHGHNRRGKRTPEYEAWASIVNRCTNPSTTSYPYYGGRGITVATEWRESFSAFLQHIGPRPSRGYSVDRIDNARGYEPGNVRWATRSEQMANTRRSVRVTIDGETRCLKAWAARLGLNYKSVHNRIRKLGWTPLEALLGKERAS